MTLRLRRDGGRYLRIGHRGAAALAPENTIAALAAALAAGVDLIEIDVVASEGPLRLAHSREELESASPTAEDALSFFAAHAPAEVGLLVDLKSPGAEVETIAALRSRDLVPRAALCSFFPDSLRTVRRLEPALATGLSYPLDRYALSRRAAVRPLVRPGLVALRSPLPLRIARMLRRAGADAAVLHHLLVTPALVRRCHTLGAAVLAWTVTAPAELERIAAAGVDGVIADDPRLFPS